jgi:hypothetical protein
MKTLLAILLLISNLGFSQIESYKDIDTNGNFYTYLILDYSKWVFVEYFPVEEHEDNGGVDTLTMVTYNPLVELDVIDSIMKYRESKGLDPIEFDQDEMYDRLVESHYYSGMDISKQIVERIVLSKYDDQNPDCNCVQSISEVILDDSLSFDEKGTSFKSLLLDKKIKRIEVNYSQIKRRQTPEIKEEHLTVKIKRKGRLLTNEYNIF